MVFSDWVFLPTDWVREERLTAFKWRHSGSGANMTAALMALTAIAHHVTDRTGLVRLTYDAMCHATCLSRAKLAKGLAVLEAENLIIREPQGRSTFQLVDYHRDYGWAKLPAKSMYRAGEISAFRDFTLRNPVELDALKLFLLLIAMRDSATNFAKIGYPKISQYTGIEKNRIKGAITYLGGLSLIHVEWLPSSKSSLGVASAYRIVGIEPRSHMGTVGRSLLNSATV